MKQFQNYDVDITTFDSLNTNKVSEEELLLIGIILPDLLKEMTQYIEQNEE